MTTEIQTVEQLSNELAPVVQQAGAITVRTPEQYSGAADFLKAVKGAQKRVVDHFAGMKAATYAAWKKVTTTEADTLKPLTDAEATVKRKMLTFANEQEAIRIAEERRIQAKADAAARREREALEKKAAAMKTEEKRQQYQEAAAAVVAPVVTVASVKPVVTGIAMKKIWRAKIVDPKAAAKALICFPDWQAYITINDGELNRFAARTKGSVALDGVTFAEETSLSSSSK